MRLQSLPLIITSTTIGALARDYSPFLDPFFGPEEDALLVKRQGCEAGLESCADLGAGGICCPAGNTCTLDQASHVACCPTGAICSGTIEGSITASVTGSATPITNSAGVVTVTGIGGGASTVTNQYYPFAYAPTTFADANQCSSAFTSCQAESTACFTSLAGVNGVTVGGVGGGITVQGVSGTLLSSVSSICSSLSAVGCANIQQVSQCSQFSAGSGVTPTTITGITGITGVGGTSTGAIVVGNNGPRQTACPGVFYAAGAGAVIGAIRGVI